MKCDIELLINHLNKGGFDGEKVLVKPNFNTADPFPASTDPDFLKAMVLVLKKIGFQKVIIGESSTFYKSSEKVINRKKLDEINSYDFVDLVNFDQTEKIEKKIPEGNYLKKATVPKLLDEVDKVIYLPCVKTHFHAEYTGSLKLSVGLMSTLEKIKFHIKNLQEKIVELNKLVNPDLIIMDGRKCFIDGGPVNGTVKKPNEILASTDRVAIDLEEVKLIKTFPGNSLEKRSPKKIPQIKKGIELGVGSADYELVEI